MRTIELDYADGYNTNRIHIVVKQNGQYVCAVFIPANLRIYISPMSDNRLMFECGWGLNETHFIIVVNMAYFEGVKI